MKKFLLGLFGIIFGLINFSSAFFIDYEDSITYLSTGTFTCPTTSSSYQFESVFSFGTAGMNGICVHANLRSINYPSAGIQLRFESQTSKGYSAVQYGSPFIENFGVISTTVFNEENIACFYGNKQYVGFVCSKNTAGYVFDYYLFDPLQLYSYNEYYQTKNQLNTCESDLNTCQNSSCQLELSQCQNDYTTCENSLGQCGTSLNSCNNALGSCMQGNIGTGEYNWSALFINGIQHLGSAVINVTIPEEISWDYTGNENIFDLNIEGYNVDSDYIQSVIDINSYRPTSEEFTDVFVSGLTFIFPYIVITLFIVFIRKLLKKIFK